MVSGPQSVVDPLQSFAEAVATTTQLHRGNAVRTTVASQHSAHRP